MAQQNPAAPASQNASSDPLANIITQVSPTGAQPGRPAAPARPSKARPAAKSKSNKAHKSQPAAAPAATTAAQSQNPPSNQVVPQSTPVPSGKPPAAVNKDHYVADSQQSSSVEDGSKTSHAGPDASSTLVDTPPPAAQEAPRDPEKAKPLPDSIQPAGSPAAVAAAPAAPQQQQTKSEQQQQTSKDQNSQIGKSPKSKKKPGRPSPVMAFLMSLGCVSKKAYEDDSSDPQTSSDSGSKPLKRRRSTEKTGASTAASTPKTSSSSHTPTSAAAPLMTANETSPASSAADDVKAQAGPSTTTQEQQQQEMAGLAVAPAEAAAPVSAAPSTSGIPLPREETQDVTSGAVVPPGADGHSHHATPKKRRSKSSTRTTDSTEEDLYHQQQQQDLSSEGEDAIGPDSEEDEESVLNEDEEEERIIQAGGMGIPVDESGVPRPLLAELAHIDSGRKCLVLDLDETLVHSSFKQISAADYIVPVEIENQTHNVFVIKRPGVDEFLRRMGEIYEVVVFTASLSKYADPVLDQLDIHRVVRHRLFRESCYNHKGNYVKDLSQLGRPIHDCIIIDNSPASYIFHPKNAVPVSSWFNDPHDTELVDMIGVLADLAQVDDVRSVLDGFIDQ